MGKWGKRIGYGIGDLGCNLVFSTMASYLMVFYTDVFGITAAAAGTMMLVTKFIDALTDTGMGLIVDRTNTKWGQERPYFVVGAVPFAVFTYTVVNIPLNTIVPRLTSDIHERIDTAIVEEIKKANDMGIICGVTTNPSLIAKSKRNFAEVIKEITEIVDGPISGEVGAATQDAQGMIAEGREIAKIHPNMIVKIPMTSEGLKAVKQLSSEGIKTNVTLIFNANQALLAARAGASYVSPFLGRLDDISVPGMDLIRTIVTIFHNYNIQTEIIAASIRNPIHVIDCALAGADIATVPYSVLEQMTRHPLTDAGIEKFIADSTK